MTEKEFIENNPIFHPNGVPNAMEEYTSYKTKELKDKIQSFRKQLHTISKGIVYKNILPDILEQFDKHFNLKK